jgi:hypothetical protein
MLAMSFGAVRGGATPTCNATDGERCNGKEEEKEGTTNAVAIDKGAVDVGVLANAAAPTSSNGTDDFIVGLFERVCLSIEVQGNTTG